MSAAIWELVDPESALQPPPPAATGEYISALRDNAGFIVGKVDWVAEKLFGVSLIEQVVKPFTGDWAALEAASNGWLNLGSSLDAGAENYRGLRTQIDGGLWTGEAAAGAGGQMVAIAEAHASQADGCRTLSEQLKHIIEVSKATGELVAGLLSLVNDFLMRLAAQMMVPIVGQITGALDTAITGTRFFGWVNKMIKAVTKLIEVAQLAMKIVMTVQRIFAVAIKGMGYATQGLRAGAGLYMDDTSRVQFGAG